MKPSKTRNIIIRPTDPQADLLECNAKFPAFVGGFGCGKSEVMCNSAITDSREGGAASVIAMYEPVFDLVRLVMAPRMEEKLIDMGIRYKYNKTENIIYTSGGGMGDFVLRSMDNPSRIVGYESMRAKIDELDVLQEKKAAEAWRKILARNRQKPKTYRKSRPRPMNTVSVFTTPEGFRFVYKTWKKNPKKGYEIIQAATQSNPFLPDDYVETLRNDYPPNLIDAYLEGKFVNLTSGTIYYCFDRVKNACNTQKENGEPLHIGLDFNVGKMAGVVHVLRDGIPHAIEEIAKGYDTPSVIAEIKLRFPFHPIYIYPDSSGKNRKSSKATETDISQLEDAGFMCMYESTNPAVKDRINAMNAMFCNAAGERRYYVNVEQCPTYTEALEQQIWAANGEPDKSADVDHPNDAGGYYIAFTFPIIKPLSSDDIEISFLR